ncbi:MAG: D-galactarolactone cycloisomerase [Deltaproteobacteria bacterium]|jgi:L-alanine-DL-glutamate epimerase-like enolase superfamily enzyme|nr:D-galactarolactone cycloisomerase [Deltaproteobacteria bacterium]
MKITKLKTVPVNLPLEKPIATAIHTIRSVGCVLVYLETDQGITGESYVFTFNAARLKVFDEMINSFAHHLEGQDPRYVEGIWQKIWSEINPIGHKGVTIYALSALDTACWDLIGKYSEMPLHHIFGACRNTVKTYASGGMWLSSSIDELVDEAQEFIEQGFLSMKIRVGNQNPETDLERVRIVRETIGRDIELMVDANQGFTPKQAIRLGRKLEKFDLAWFEEPVSANNLKGHAEVRSALNIPIASGETEYTRYGMKAMLDAQACDVLMPDLQRIGGLSEFRKVASLAAAYEIPVSTHIFTEQSLCIAASSPNCISVEHMPWFSALFCESMEIKDGMLEIPDRPGIGFTFDADSVKRFRMD